MCVRVCVCVCVCACKPLSYVNDATYMLASCQHVDGSSCAHHRGRDKCIQVRACVRGVALGVALGVGCMWECVVKRSRGIKSDRRSSDFGCHRRQRQEGGIGRVTVTV